MGCDLVPKELGQDGVPETKSPDRPQYFVVTNDQSCACVEPAENFGIVTDR
jgi:hypothetical protein